MDTNQKIGERIKGLREARQLSQQQVADAVKVSRVAVTKWESANTPNLKIDNLLGLSKLFNVSIEELINGDNKGDHKNFGLSHNETKSLYINEPEPNYLANLDNVVTLSPEEEAVVEDFIAVFRAGSYDRKLTMRLIIEQFKYSKEEKELDTAHRERGAVDTKATFAKLKKQTLLKKG